MERLQDQRDSFRVSLRKKQHLSMLSQKRFKLDQATSPLDNGILQERIHKFMVLYSTNVQNSPSMVVQNCQPSSQPTLLDSLKDITKLTINSANVNSILQNYSLLLNINTFLQPQYNGSKLQAEATWIWANLSTEASVEQLQSIGLFKMLLDCFIQNTDNKIRHNCIWSFNNFMVNSREVKIGLLQSNFLNSLEYMLQSSPAVSELESILKSIALTASEDTPATYVMFRQFLKQINQLLCSSQQRLYSVVLCCMSRFCRLPYSDIFISDMKARRMIKPLLTIQKAIKDQGLFQAFLVIIQSYSINSENNTELLNNNLIPVLDQMLRRTFLPNIKLRVLYMTQKLLSQPQTVQKILTSTLFGSLKKQASQDDVQVRFQIIKILTICVRQVEPMKCMCMNKVQEIGMILKHFYEVETHELFDETMEAQIKQALQHIDTLQLSL